MSEFNTYINLFSKGANTSREHGEMPITTGIQAGDQVLQRAHAQASFEQLIYANSLILIYLLLVFQSGGEEISLGGSNWR